MRHRLLALLGTAAVLPGPAAHAQEPPPPAGPRLTALKPLTGSRGATVMLECAGGGLAGTRAALWFDSPFPQIAPPSGAQGLAAVVRESSDVVARLELKIAPDAVPGVHELRVVTPRGLTNALPFYVAHFREAAEAEPNNEPSGASVLTLPVDLGGAIQAGGDQDWFRFGARKGDRLVIEVESFRRSMRENRGAGVAFLDSHLALHDTAGVELASSDDAARRDARLVFDCPRDGDYLLQLRDLHYEGRPDYGYRLTIGPRPILQGIVPSGGQYGTRSSVTLHGVNLDGQGARSLRRTMVFPLEGTPAQPVRVALPTGVSNALPLFASAHGELAETEPNDDAGEAQRVIAPITLTGCADYPGDTDTFRVLAQVGQRLIAEVQATRYGSPYESYLTLSETTGRLVRADDDGAGGGDARLDVQIPRTDEYLIRIRDLARAHVGPECSYRLTIRPVNTALAVLPPEQVVVPRGKSVEARVQLTRLDGFPGDVEVQLMRGAAAQVAADPLVIKNGQNAGNLKLTSGEAAPETTHFNLLLRAVGRKDNREYAVTAPLWLTVAPP